MKLPLTAGKLITLDFGKMKFCFHEESFILAEKTQSAGIANSLTGIPRSNPNFYARNLFIST